MSKKLIAVIATSAILLGFNASGLAFGATLPTLGTVSTFGVLSSTFTRNIGVTTITGDAGYTTLSGGGTDTVSGTTYVPAPAQTGIDQATALADLNSQACTLIGAAVDLASFDIDGVGPILPGHFSPGCYSTTGAMNIGGGGTVTLDGVGVYIFRSGGALDTTANSVVSLNGPSACDIFWTAVGATTLGADSIFIGTDIDDAGITIGNNVTWTGRALSFAETITTDSDTITVPSCGLPIPANLHIIKAVDNTGGGTADLADFILHVEQSGTDVAGSPQAGTTTPGTSYLLSAGTYNVSEEINLFYAPTYTGPDCNADGEVILSEGDDKTCTVTNTYIVPIATSTPPVVESSSSGSSVHFGCKDLTAENYEQFAASDPALCVYVQAMTTVLATTTVLALTAVAPVVALTVFVPSLPNTGFPPKPSDSATNLVIQISLIISILTFFIIILCQRKIHQK